MRQRQKVQAVLQVSKGEGMTRLPPANRIPDNVEGPRTLIEEIFVGSWCPACDGKGPATEVHLQLKIRGIDTPLTFRCKTAKAVNQLIASLERHRNDVWPNG